MGKLVRVGVTGHLNLTEHSTELVYHALVAALHEYAGRPLRGVTCLAEGADQIFARAVLATRGSFEVILPARDYRHRCVSPSNAGHFDTLLGCAVTVTYACAGSSGDLAYAAANDELLRRCEHLFAVWDGQPTDNAGGTARVVALAEGSGVQVTRVWPHGTRRT